MTLTGLRTTRWKATIEVEFTTTDYPAVERTTAERQAGWAKRATERGDTDINCSRNEVRVASVERAS